MLEVAYGEIVISLHRGCFLLVDYVSVTRYPFLGFVGVVLMNCNLLGKGFSLVYRQTLLNFW